MPGVAESRRCSGGAKPNQDDGKRSIYLRRQLPRGAPPSKMSKTTPCKAAGVQRRNLTCRANRWYFSIIPKSRKPHRLRQGREPRSTSVAGGLPSRDIGPGSARRIDRIGQQMVDVDDPAEQHQRPRAQEPVTEEQPGDQRGHRNMKKQMEDGAGAHRAGPDRGGSGYRRAADAGVRRPHAAC